MSITLNDRICISRSRSRSRPLSLCLSLSLSLSPFLPFSLPLSLSLWLALSLSVRLVVVNCTHCQHCLRLGEHPVCSQLSYNLSSEHPRAYLDGDALWCKPLEVREPPTIRTASSVCRGHRASRQGFQCGQPSWPEGRLKS